MWGQLFLFLATVYSLYLIIKHVPGLFRDIKIITVTALFIWLFSQINYTGEFNLYEEKYHDFNLIIIISLILSTELIIVRIMRPGVFRYPHFLVLTPLLIPVSFILIIDTYMIRDIVFITTQGIAIVVYLLLLLEKDELALALASRKSVIGISLLLLAYVTYWFIQNYISLNAILWESMTAVGTVLIIQSFVKKLNNKNLDI